jgi:hypothetical protein
MKRSVRSPKSRNDMGGQLRDPTPLTGLRFSTSAEICDASRIDRSPTVSRKYVGGFVEMPHVDGLPA